MDLRENEVTLKLKSRPLRCAFLVRHREDLLDAITLFTHVWGGAANAILPMPNSDEAIRNLKFTLDWMNPDYIFVPREELPLQPSQIFENSPALVRPISKIEITQHTDGIRANLLHLQNGILSHIGFILLENHQSYSDGMKVNLIDIDENFCLELALHLGLPSQPYRSYLLDNWGARTLARSESIEQLLKSVLTITKLWDPIRLTLLKTVKTGNALVPYLMSTSDEETLCLFLDNGQDIGIATAFWNCRWLFPYNKIFLPRDPFLKEIKICVLQIIEFMPHIRALHVTTPLDRMEALRLYSDLKNAFLDAGREVLVKIIYRDFYFDWVPGTLSSGETIDCTRAITAEGCVRFAPTTPVDHEKNNFIFGYDANVKFVSGRQFFHPKTLGGSHLLNNELWRLEYFDENKDALGKMWLKQNLPVRSATEGVTGISIPGKECSFFIHPDEVVITRQLKEVGFRVKPNKHTRYAQGLVKRLGGIEKVTYLINDGGADIISVLTADGADQIGLNESKIKSALIKKRDFDPIRAHKAVKEKIKPLLASDLLRRGYCYECPNCNLKVWLPLEEIREFIECKGCAEQEQLPLDDLQFTYKTNELAAQLIREGGLAVLMTAATLKQILSLSSSFIQFGGDFLRLENKSSFAEVDLFWLTEKALIISECKYIFIKQQANELAADDELKEKFERIRVSLKNNLEVARLISASAVILGVVTNLSDVSRLLSIVTDMTEVARSQKIGLHLVLNGAIHLWGSPNGVDPKKADINLDSLLVKETFSDEFCIGESPSHYGGAIGSKGICDEDVLKQWEFELFSSRK